MERDRDRQGRGRARARARDRAGRPLRLADDSATSAASERLHEAVCARVARVGFGIWGTSLPVTETRQKGHVRGRRPQARRARAAGRPRRPRRAVPDPLRPDLQLPAHDRRQPARRRRPDDADVHAHARVDQQVPLIRPFSAWLFRIAHNLSWTARANRRWQPEEGSSGAARRGASAEDEAFQSIGRQSMLDLIDSLSQEQQQV